MGPINTNTMAMLLPLVAEHRLPADTFVIHEFSFDQMLEAYDVFGHAADHNALKVLIHGARLISRPSELTNPRPPTISSVGEECRSASAPIIRGCSEGDCHRLIVGVRSH
jgi:hypothetical protein